MTRRAVDSKDQALSLRQIGRRVAQIGRQLYLSERLVWALIGVGILLRLAQYAANRSLWLDESFLALNIVNRSYGGLLQPLAHSQGAPLGFLLLERLAVRVLGNSEYALRLVPLISGIISLLLFYKVARRSISPGAVPIALGLFAISDPLIYYASEVKQYSTDVAVALLVLSSARVGREDSGLSIPQALGLAIIGAFSLWFSHPAVFVLMGVGTIAFMIVCRNGDWVRIGRLSVVALVWISSLAVTYYLSLRYIRTDEDLLAYYQYTFFPFPPSLASVRWLWSTFLHVFEYPVGLSLPGIGALACLVGVIALWRESRVTLLALLLPLFFALAASAFRLYPFEGRQLLFAVPFFILLIGEGTARLGAATKAYSPMIGVLLVGLLFLHPVVIAGSHLVKARTVEEIRPVMAYLKTHEENGDILYLYHSSAAAFSYYSGRYGFAADGSVPDAYVHGGLLQPLAHSQGSPILVGIYAREDRKKYLADLDRLRGKRRAWILFSHVWKDEKDYFLSYLDTRGTRLDSFGSDGASVYLYDLSKKD